MPRERAMSEIEGFIDRPGGHRLAFRRMPGRGPVIVWLGGFGSDMAGTKAEALAQWAARTGQAYVRFDYFGHGRSSGEFAQGTIGRWRDDAMAALDELAEGPAVLAGSSMGGWIACLLALARPDKVAGLVLIAPAADFTEKLIWPSLNDEQRRAIETEGLWLRPSPYETGNQPISRALIEDGALWSILPGPVEIGAPVRILQGMRDADVPWRHALELAQAIEGQDVVFSLIKDGDHRLSRPQDLARLVAAVEELL
jgi:hypothetical protein